MHKGSTQTNKKSKLGFKRKEQKKPKRTLVWRTGLSGVPCRATATAPTVVCKSEQCVNSARIACAETEQAPEGAPDSEQGLSSAPPDCPVAQLSEAPTVEP